MSARGGDAPFRGLLITSEGSLVEAARRGERAETFDTFKARLRQRLSPNLDLAEPIAVRVALAKVAPEVVAEDPWLGPIAKRGGRAWLRLLDAMFEALGVLSDRREALAIVARCDDGTAGRARLLERLARAVDRRLANVGWVDSRRETDRVADLIAHSEASVIADAVGALQVRARGIVEWTPADLALWRVLDASLSRAGGRATIELPVFERPLDAERERDPLDTVIEAVASALDDAPLTTPIASPLGDLCFDRSFTLGSAQVEIRQATSAEAQGRAVAAAVHEAMSAGAAPSEIVVALVSEDETSAHEVVRALEDVGIAAIDARAARTSRSRLVAFADQVLEVAERGAARGEVALLLRSAYVDAAQAMGLGDEAAERSLRELARALEETPTANAEDDDIGERLAATVMVSSPRLGRSRVPLAHAARRLGRALARAAAGTTRAEHIAAARHLWSVLGLRPTPVTAGLLTRTGPLRALDRSDLAARARDDGGWRSLERALTSYERAIRRLAVADEPTSLESFRHELAWLVARQPSLRRRMPDAVPVIRFADLTASTAATVVIVDADAETWPDGRTRARLIPTSLEDRLVQASDPALRPLVQAGGAQVLARLAIGVSGAEHVVFTYQARDPEGGAQSPAPVVAWLARAASSTTWASGVIPLAPLNEHERLLRELMTHTERAKRLVPDAHRRATLERRREESFGLELAEIHPLAVTLPKGDAFEAILRDETGGGDRPLSASAIDRLAACVFRGFVTEVVRPKRALEAHDVADAREEGNLAHAALEAAFRATAPLWSVRPRDRETILRVGLAAADGQLAREQAASALARVVVDQVQAGVRAVLEWSIADEEWDFARAEQAFGNTEEGAWGAVVLERGGTRVALRGKIDRVDVAHASGAVRVIDYKTKERSAEDHTAAFGTTKFQLALYARAAQAGLTRAAGEGLYLPTQRLRPGGAPRKHAERWAEAHELTEGMPTFERTVLALLDDVRQGRVGVRPYSAASCDYCDLDGVCRKPRFAPAAPTDEVDSAGPKGEGGR